MDTVVDFDIALVSFMGRYFDYSRPTAVFCAQNFCSHNTLGDFRSLSCVKAVFASSCGFADLASSS